MTLIRKAAIAAIALLLMPLTASADGNFVLFKYGNFDTWVTRQIHESAVIGSFMSPRNMLPAANTLMFIMPRTRQVSMCVIILAQCPEP